MVNESKKIAAWGSSNTVNKNQTNNKKQHDFLIEKNRILILYFKLGPIWR